MDQEKIDEYYRNVKVMADSFYGLGKMVRLIFCVEPPT